MQGRMLRGLKTEMGAQKSRSNPINVASVLAVCVWVCMTVCMGVYELYGCV